MNPITHAAAIIGCIGVIGGGAYALDGRYAKRSALLRSVGANAQAIALLQIENAARASKPALLRRLCDDFRRVHRWSPSLCR
jgi:hypothetical protein